MVETETYTMFIEECGQCFSFLLHDYAFKEGGTNHDSTEISIKYIRDKAVIDIHYEPRDNVILVYLGEGSEISEATKKNKETIKRKYYLDLLINLLAPEERVEQEKDCDYPFIRADFHNILCSYAEFLKDYAEDFLLGDLSVLGKLEKVMEDL